MEFLRVWPYATKILICLCTLKRKVVCCFTSKADRNHTGTLFPCIHNYWPQNSLHFNLNTSSFIHSQICTVNPNTKENLQMLPQDKVNVVPAALEACFVYTDLFVTEYTEVSSSPSHQSSLPLGVLNGHAGKLPRLAVGRSTSCTYSFPICFWPGVGQTKSIFSSKPSHCTLENSKWFV